MEPLGGELKRELGRFGPQGAIGDTVAAWPGAVGPEIARNSWPARFQRDGTLIVHVRDSVWGFELTQRAAEIASRLPGSPPLKFVPGTRSGARRGVSRDTLGAASAGNAGTGRGGRPLDRRDRGRGAPRAGRGSRSCEPRAGSGQPLRLIHFTVPANAEFAGLFS